MTDDSNASDSENEGLEAAEEEIDEEPEAGLGPGAEDGADQEPAEDGSDSGE